MNRAKSVFTQTRTDTKILHLSLLAFTDITLAKTLNKRYACIKNLDLIIKNKYLKKRKILLEKSVLENNCDKIDSSVIKTKKYNIRSKSETFTRKKARKSFDNCNESRKVLIKNKTTQAVFNNLKLDKKKTRNEEIIRIKNFKKKVILEKKNEKTINNNNNQENGNENKRVISSPKSQVLKENSKNFQNDYKTLPTLKNKSVGERKKSNDLYIENSLSRRIMEKVEEKIDEKIYERDLNLYLESDFENQINIGKLSQEMMDEKNFFLEENLKKESFEKEEFSNQSRIDQEFFNQEPKIENENQHENIKLESNQINNQVEDIECHQIDSIKQNEKLSLEQNFISKLRIEEKKKENLTSQYAENEPHKSDTECKASASFSREFLTKENVISLLNLDAKALNRHEIKNSLQQDLQTNEENSQKPKFSLVKQLKLSLNRKNSEKKSGEINSSKFFKKSSLFKNSIEKKDDQKIKTNENIYDDNVEKKSEESDGIIESLNETNKKIDMENKQFKISINSQEQERISEIKRKSSSLKNYELNFDPSFNREESDISVSCQLFHSDKNLKNINDLKIKKSFSNEENQDFLFINNETKDKVKKDLLIYQISEINSIENEKLNEEVLDTFFEVKGQNLGQYVTKIESSVQLKSFKIELCNDFSSKTEDLLNFQNDFLDESYNIDDNLKSATSSFLDHQIEQIQNVVLSKSISTLISDNEYVFREIEKKSHIFHSKNYYHLIDKGDLDQSDDQSNYRQSEIIKETFENQIKIENNNDKLRLSYSCISLPKNNDSLSSLKEEKLFFLKEKTNSLNTLSKRSSKSSNISAYESIRFYCLLKYRIKHLLKKN